MVIRARWAWQLGGGEPVADKKIAPKAAASTKQAKSEKAAATRVTKKQSLKKHKKIGK